MIMAPIAGGLFSAAFAAVQQMNKAALSRITCCAPSDSAGY
ncbi:hypothetical protein ABE057_06045 [Bacillus paralicheniformis]